MILGLSLVQFTYLHVFLSLVGLGAGIFIVYGLLTSRRLSILTSLFLVTTVATSLTGFLYPFNGITPGIILGILSMIVLVLAIVALYVKKLAGPWRGTYVVTVMLAYYFNFFVLVAQSFAKVPALHSIAPTQASPGFGFTQAAILVIFILLTIRAFKKFHPV
ncbi:MAG: hypothetical protein ABR987_01130 [Terracidiphilus sp.]